jgi:hypothetical protein
LNQVGDNFLGSVDGNCKPDALGFGVNGGIDTDQVAVDV